MVTRSARASTSLRMWLRQQHGAAELAQPRDVLAEDLFHQRVQPGGGLVEHSSSAAPVSASQSAAIRTTFAGCPWSRCGSAWLGRGRTARAARRGRVASPSPPGVAAGRSGRGLAARKLGPELDVAGHVGQPPMKRDGIGPRVTAEESTCRRPARRRPSRIRIVVDLPAPLGPRKPCTSPRHRRRSRPSRALTVPNLLVSPWIPMAGPTVEAADRSIVGNVLTRRRGLNGSGWE